jgi:hypothetical protein
MNQLVVIDFGLKASLTCATMFQMVFVVDKSTLHNFFTWFTQAFCDF